MSEVLLARIMAFLAGAGLTLLLVAATSLDDGMEACQQRHSFDTCHSALMR